MKRANAELRNIARQAGIDVSARRWKSQVREYLLNNPEALAAALVDADYDPNLLMLFFVQRRTAGYRPGGLAEKTAKNIELAIEALPPSLRWRAETRWNSGTADVDVADALSKILK